MNTTLEREDDLEDICEYAEPYNPDSRELYYCNKPGTCPHQEDLDYDKYCWKIMKKWQQEI